MVIEIATLIVPATRMFPGDEILELGEIHEKICLTAQFVGDHRRLRTNRADNRHPDTTPLQRLVTRAEIAEMVCLLCTDAFDSVTGATLVMDGGRSVPRIKLGQD